MIKTAFHVRISTVKFAGQFKESPCSPVVTFPSFGSEGHGVQPPQGDSFFLFVLDFSYVSFSYNLIFLSLKPSKVCVEHLLRKDIKPG